MAGIFVGGASRRMGGRPKGCLRGHDGRTLVERWRALLVDELRLDVVLVGRREAYAHVSLPGLDDTPPGVGPLGGLAALLTYAGERRAIAVACDMPFLTPADIDCLLAAGTTAAPRRDGRWEPLCAIYEPRRALPMIRRRIASGEHSLQALLEELAPVPVSIPPSHLDDWDRPEDIEGRSD